MTTTPPEDRAFSQYPPKTQHQLLEVLRQTEARNHELRIRNGELLTLLTKLAPDEADKLIPLSSYPIRYKVLDKILERATELALHSKNLQLDNNSSPLAVHLKDLTEAVEANTEYWERADLERQKRDEENKKRQASREKNKKAKDADDE